MENQKTLLIASYPPRECGIATFSKDLASALERCFGNTLEVEVCALENSDDDAYDYPEEVKYTIDSRHLSSFLEVADQLNERSDIGTVCVQHEFGLFGGEHGSHLLAFLLRLNLPVCCAFHTVLPNPSENLAKVVRALDHLTKQIIVLTQTSAEILMRDYGISRKKITVIPHGTHTVLWNEKQLLKQKYRLKNKHVLSTFGFLSKNKNIDTVLKALPKVLARFPDTVYLVIGKTHPEVLKKDGEQYREKLKRMAAELGIGHSVVFVDEYLELRVLLEHLSMTDIYLFASNDPNQAVSGTFAYAMSCGCAIVSTPNLHTQECLDKSNGVLLKGPDSPEEIEKAIIQLLERPQVAIDMGKNSMAKMRACSWENAAIAYAGIFQKYLKDAAHIDFRLPPVNAKHIEDMTTDFGMLQFAQLSKPDYSSGYTLDDNARALVSMAMYYEAQRRDETLQLIKRYLKFIKFCQREDGLFYNYVDIQGNFTAQNDEVNLEDSNGRAIWALGFVIASHNVLPMNMVVEAEACLTKAMPHATEFKSPRAISFVIKGIYLYQQCKFVHSLEASTKKLADELLRIYNLTTDNDWMWFEDYLTYANSVLPEAMLHAWLVTKDPKYREIAEITFDFLLSHYFMKGEIKVISNKGWFNKSNERKFHGEQPIEVAYTIFALDLFYQVTGKKKFARQLKIAFSWFLGNNHLKQIMYNPVNGAGYDGLEKENVNINQGAESTVCFFMARMIAEGYKDVASQEKPGFLSKKTMDIHAGMDQGNMRGESVGRNIMESGTERGILSAT